MSHECSSSQSLVMVLPNIFFWICILYFDVYLKCSITGWFKMGPQEASSSCSILQYKALEVDKCKNNLWATWMHYESLILRHLSACRSRIPSGPNSIFPVNHHYKKDVSETVDRTPQTVKKVNYYSLFYEFLDRKAIFICAISCTWWGLIMRMCSGPHSVEANLKAANFFRLKWMNEWLNRCHLGVQYSVFMIHAWWAPIDHLFVVNMHHVNFGKGPLYKCRARLKALIISAFLQFCFSSAYYQTNETQLICGTQGPWEFWSRGSVAKCLNILDHTQQCSSSFIHQFTCILPLKLHYYALY